MEPPKRISEGRINLGGVQPPPATLTGLAVGLGPQEFGPGSSMTTLRPLGTGSPALACCEIKRSGQQTASVPSVYYVGTFIVKTQIVEER
jgi:hypothetical protein